MIGKKVGNPSKSSSKSRRAGGLMDYIDAPKKNNNHEKCIYSHFRNFLTETHEGMKAEMIALAQEAVRSKDPINHYVLSWREGEQPTLQQVEKAVDIVLDELGLKDHQAFYGLHSDTDNIHLHIMVNRVHPDTLKVIKPNKGFDIESIHKAVARIEHVQGWQREQNGRYEVLEDGKLGRAVPYDPEKPRQPDQPKRDMENRTGEKSVERIAIEEGAPIIKKAQTWEQLHRELLAKGMRYEKTGSGATLFVGDVGVKASSADRDASLSKLQKRLGAYQPPPQRQQVAQRAPEPIKPDIPGWNEYITGRKFHYAEKTAAKLSLDKQQEQERKQLYEQQKTERNETLGGSWKGKGVLLNALRSVLAAQQASGKVELKERHSVQRKKYRERYRPYPDLEQWQRMRQRPDLAEQWRHRASEGGPQRIEGDRREPPTLRDIRAYVAQVYGQQVHYRRMDEAGEGGVPAFVDKGKTIEVHDWRSRDSTLAALQLSAQKWGSFTVSGDDEYTAICISLAAEHGFKINNPELQNAILAERERIHKPVRAVAAVEGHMPSATRPVSRR